MKQNTEDKQIIASIISNETGEIIEEIYEGDSYTKRSKEQKDYINIYDKNFKQGVGFVKLYDDVVPMLREKLTPTEFIFTISLAKYVTYQDCILKKSDRIDGVILNAKTLAEELNMDYGVVRRLISSLKKKGVIGIHETGSIIPEYEGSIKKVITVNPNIYFRGVDVNKSIKLFYADSGW